MTLKNQALLKMVDQVIDQNATVNALKSDVSELKSDVAVLKSDVAVLKSDVSELKSDVSEIKGEIRRLDVKIDQRGADLRELIHRQAIAYENMDRNIMLILDAVIPAQGRAEKIDRLDNAVENHEIRISVVEDVVKSHLSESHSPRS